uniref:SFRICE_017199 n=1 Tax=Spodoptera frugiperda TaxID=7108 RepID=A0A2H1VTT8_SPOFR
MSHIDYRRANQWMTSQISCIAHRKFTCELTRIKNPNEQQLGRKPARLITSPDGADAALAPHEKESLYDSKLVVLFSLLPVTTPAFPWDKMPSLYFGKLSKRNERSNPTNGKY